MPDWLLAFLTAAVLIVLGAVLGSFLTRLQRKAEKLDEQRQAAAAFRFELQSNLGWLDDIVESRNYLRDEAWVRMKNDGYVSYLPSPIPLRVIRVYDGLHRLNEQIRVLKESQNDAAVIGARMRAQVDKESLRREIEELIRMFDSAYPEIARNFKIG
jgi:hypothetical protein